MSEKSAVYECVDREHDAWRCRACGYIENFEADGPTENGWHFCPGSDNIRRPAPHGKPVQPRLRAGDHRGSGQSVSVRQ